MGGYNPGEMTDPGHVTVAATALRLVGAAAFGGVVGIEREVDGHDAGLRTHLLLALGSAVFGVISVGAFGSFMSQGNTHVSYDPGRIASYVAAGIGFLGGGAILKRGDRVQGLTTAASLWVVAAIGLASGLGFWSGAVIATVIAAAALLADSPLARLTDYLRRRIHPAEGDTKPPASERAADAGSQASLRDDHPASGQE